MSQKKSKSRRKQKKLEYVEENRKRSKYVNAKENEIKSTSKEEEEEEEEKEGTEQGFQVVEDVQDKKDDEEDKEGEGDEEDADEFKELLNNSESKEKLIKEAKKYTEQLENRGVIYISRIPPRMTPQKIKAQLNIFDSEVTRVFLVEEDEKLRKKRKKNGGNARKRYIEGWAEFQDRKVAKRVAKALNNTPITNDKHSIHFGDIWNLKFLRNFHWSHLTEKVAYEKRVREQKLRLEMMQVKKENNLYKTLVEKGQAMDHIERRRKRKGHDSTHDNAQKRKFRQIQPIYDDKKSVAVPLLASIVKK